jgi:hypothetical protein
MAYTTTNPSEIIPKKFAVKFSPPVIALEYFHSGTNLDYLLQINLEGCLKTYDDPDDICKWIFRTYDDIINTNIVSEKQVKNILIIKISVGFESYSKNSYYEKNG